MSSEENEITFISIACMRFLSEIAKQTNLIQNENFDMEAGYISMLKTYGSNIIKVYDPLAPTNVDVDSINFVDNRIIFPFINSIYKLLPDENKNVSSLLGKIIMTESFSLQEKEKNVIGAFTILSYYAMPWSFRYDRLVYDHIEVISKGVSVIILKELLKINDIGELIYKELLLHVYSNIELIDKYSYGNIINYSMGNAQDYQSIFTILNAMKSIIKESMIAYLTKVIGILGINHNSMAIDTQFKKLSMS
jgi:hypothetical protein